MLKIFTGDDRVRALAEVTKELGQDYEVIDGAEIEVKDLPMIFMGMSLLSAERKILIRDMGENKAAFSELTNYLTTPHKVILFETKLDKRSVTYKNLKDKVEVREFKLPEPNFGVVFEIYRTAKRDGGRAVKMLEEIKLTEEPVKFTGLLVSQAMKDFVAHPGVREKRVLKELARVDVQMKTTGMEPWLIVEGFLARLASL
ncbi:hypothetical protein IJJ37_00365 [Candidatus Saccharibacteria bacterium]|nr:hypothetical protein [Candidatus Saccharibacteria bacterium]